MGVSNVKINEIQKVWPLIASFVSVPHTEEQYENAVRILDQLIEKVGEDENHPLASLMETLGALIESYESQHFPEPSSDSIGALNYL